MNALVKKEIRLLLPAFALGSGLAYSNLFMPNPFAPAHDYILSPYWYLFPLVICPLMAVMLALQSFGAEVSAGTFSALLAQPIPRKRIWNTKISLLLLAFFVMAFFWYAAFTIQTLRRGHSPDWLLLLEVVGIFVAVICSGGLWTVLLLRQVTAAFWITVLMPAGIAASVFYFTVDEPSSRIGNLLMLALGAYSIAGFILARWLFLRAQDVEWTGTNIGLPAFRGLSGFKIGSGLRRQWSPRLALLAKEFQFHQSQLVIAGVLLVLHLAVIVIRNCTHFSQSSSLGLCSDNFWCLWLLMPLLVGGTAVAEERRLGTLDSQLCLPIRHQTQFAVKIGGVLLLSLLFGMVMPLLLEPKLQLSLLPGNFPVNPQGFDLSPGWQFSLATLRTVMPWTPLLGFAAAVAAVGLISCYASTLSRNTLQALSLAVLGILLLWFLFVAATNPDTYLPAFAGFFLGPPLLNIAIGVPALVLAMWLLARRNYRRSTITWRAWLANLLVLTGALVTAVLVIATLMRIWPSVMPSMS